MKPWNKRGLEAVYVVEKSHWRIPMGATSDQRLEIVHRFISGTGKTYDAMVWYATFGIDSDHSTKKCATRKFYVVLGNRDLEKTV